MDNRLREIEQWVAEARDGLGDGGREAYVRKLYLLDAEIRAVIKDSGILPQADSPRPATSLVRHLTSLALPVASAVVVLAVATVYLRGGIANTDSSILTARPESAQKNTPPAGPSSTPADWQQYLASKGETIVEFATLPAPVGKPDDPAMGVAPVRSVGATNKPSKVVLAAVNGTSKPAHVSEPKEAGGAGATPAPLILASAKKPVQADANESTSVASSPVMLAGYKPAPAEEAPAGTPTAPKKIKNRKAAKPVDEGEEPVLDLDALHAGMESELTKHSKPVER